MSEGLGGLLFGIAAFLTAILGFVRYHRLERRQSSVLVVEGALAEAEEAVTETLVANRSLMQRRDAEMGEMGAALSEERRRRAELETELVQLKAEVAKVKIAYTHKVLETAQLEARIDRLLGGEHVSIVDARGIRLEDHERES